MNPSKVFTYLLLTLGVVYGLIWVFNHINPWLSIGGAVLCIYALISFLKDKNKPKPTVQ